MATWVIHGSLNSTLVLAAGILDRGTCSHARPGPEIPRSAAPDPEREGRGFAFHGAPSQVAWAFRRAPPPRSLVPTPGVFPSNGKHTFLTTHLGQRVVSPPKSWAHLGPSSKKESIRWRPVLDERSSRETFALSPMTHAPFSCEEHPCWNGSKRMCFDPRNTWSRSWILSRS